MAKNKHWRDSINEHNQNWINDRGRKPKEIVTKTPTKKYRDGWDRIFGSKKESSNDE